MWDVTKLYNITLHAIIIILIDKPRIEVTYSSYKMNNCNWSKPEFEVISKRILYV